MATLADIGCELADSDDSLWREVKSRVASIQEVGFLVFVVVPLKNDSQTQRCFLARRTVGSSMRREHPPIDRTELPAILIKATELRRHAPRAGPDRSCLRRFF